MSEHRIEVPLGKLLCRSDEVVPILAEKIYSQVTVRLWGQGITKRNTVSGREIGGDTRFVVRRNQFIMSRIDARHGAFGLVPEELDGAVVSNDFPAYIINEDLAIPSFLDWMSKTHGFVQACKAASEGTTNRVRLKEQQFLSKKVLLPPLTEQRELVSRLDAVSGKINQVRALRLKGDYELSALKVSQHLFLAGERTVRLDEVLELHEEHTPIYNDQSYPQVGVRGFGQGLFSKSAVEGSQTTYRSYNRLYDGAVVLSQVKGWEGAIAVCPPHLAGWFVSPEYRTFRCLPGQAIPNYLSSIVSLPWFWSRLKDATHGMGGRRERTRPEQFLKIEIPMPTVAQQEKALQILAHLNGLRPLMTQSDLGLEALLPSLLDRAFQGRL